jgi:hypothetical protein
MKSASLQVVFDGEALKDGQIEVRDLAPSLLALADLYGHTNQYLNGEKSNLKIFVKADVKKGSFHVDLHLVQGWIESAKQMVITGQLKQVDEVISSIQSIGTNAGGIVVGLLGLWRFFKGKPTPTPVAQDKINVTFIGDDNQYLNSTVQTMNIYNIQAIRQDIRGFFGPLMQEGIDELRVGSDSVPTANDTILKSEVIDALRGRDEEESPNVEKQLQLRLTIEKASFNPNYKWTFSNNGNRIGAKITDREFNSRIADRSLQFTKGDMIVATVEQASSVDPETGDMTLKYTVTRVLQYLPSMRQQSFGSIKEPGPADA